MSQVWVSCEGVEELEGVEEDVRALMTAAECDDCEVSIVLCGDAWIRPLNKEWRGKDMATDVLSFPQEHEVILGDLVVSLETAALQAKERDYELRDEVRVLLVHGLLHLLGYDHETGREEQEEMAAAEAKLLDGLAWKGQGLIGAAHGT